jgi:histidine ammonia-lyase
MSLHRNGARASLCLLALVLSLSLPPPAGAQASLYTPIAPTKAGTTVTLTGRDMTIEQVVDIARHGARVALTPEARQRSADAYGLLLQAQLEGVVMYGFNRNYGAGRQEVSLAGDPLSPENRAILEERQLTRFRNNGPRLGYGPEVAEEEVVRAMMAVRANNMSFEFASPQLTQMLLDLLNHRITPVVQSRGTPGEANLAQLDAVAGAMVGAGDAYFQGVRMPAAEALKAAGLTPLKPFAADDYALDSTNAYSVGLGALLVADAREALEWADLTYAMDLLGMNSSVTPISYPVQRNRPHEWLNWQAGRVIAMIRGSYLFEDDPGRILQDPESLRASAIRQGSAWKAWGELRDSVLFQMNSSDHNPAVLVGMTPDASWELSTPHFMKYFVKGGRYSGGKPGYIVSNANWDPYPISNDVEAFTIALANMMVAVQQRIDRFADPFVTGVAAADVLTPAQRALGPALAGDHAALLYQELATWAVPVTPTGNASNRGIGDLQSNSVLKTVRARQAVDLAMQVIAYDLLTASYWMDVRKLQNPARNFGQGPAAAWAAFRQVVPFQQAVSDRQAEPLGVVAHRFVRDNPPSTFTPSGVTPSPDWRP